MNETSEIFLRQQSSQLLWRVASLRFRPTLLSFHKLPAFALVLFRRLNIIEASNRGRLDRTDIGFVTGENV